MAFSKMHLSSALFLAMIATTATAQSASQTTLTLPFYGYDTQSIDASIIGVTSGATTMSLACPLNNDDSECGLFPYQTLTYGPSTYNMYMSAPQNAFVGTQDCVLATATATEDGATATAAAAVCAESASGGEANFPGVSTEVYSGSQVARLGVTVTAGAGVLESASQSAGGGAVPTTTVPSTGFTVLSGPEATMTSEASSGSGGGAAAATTGTGSAAASSSTATGNSASGGMRKLGSAGIVVGVVGLFVL